MSRMWVWDGVGGLVQGGCLIQSVSSGLSCSQDVRTSSRTVIVPTNDVKDIVSNPCPWSHQPCHHHHEGQAEFQATQG